MNLVHNFIKKNGDNMQFGFKIGTKVLFGKGCLIQNKELVAKCGKRALIVTSKNSAKASGALSHVEEILKEYNIDYSIYDRVENNPSLENVAEGGKAAREFKADFIIGIGGGSPLDASKAIAVLAVNDIEPLDLYKNVFENKPLPIVAIPTTAGTGSEVTPYSILTRDDIKTKMSFGNEDTFPKLAFIDATYTESMPYETAVDTAVDALSHAMEGYLSKRSTPVSDVLALEAMKVFSECTNAIIDNNIDFNIREKLLYVSMLGGMVISHTGTTIIHGLGYSLTYFKGIPHGRANGYFMQEYLKFNYEAVGEKINKILELFKVSSIDEFGDIIEKMVKKDLSLSSEEIKNYAALTMKQRSTSYNARQVNEKDLVEILEKTFLMK
ncbi:MAG TPA: iron-containing alcohol dehydrogenase family protein [Acetivibrio clariflavus]|nr:iron-containing alcohol dehydrogenase family protein [Acetivibrio clariflavus]